MGMWPKWTTKTQAQNFCQNKSESSLWAEVAKLREHGSYQLVKEWTQRKQKPRNVKRNESSENILSLDLIIPEFRWIQVWTGVAARILELLLRNNSLWISHVPAQPEASEQKVLQE